jgi:uncharacterized protein (DUF362 family)
MTPLSRRDFIRTIGAAGIGIYASSLVGCKRNGEKIAARVLRENELSDKLAVASGGDIEEMVRSALKALGGMDKLVRKGDIVVVKPNIGWAQPPENGASTNPNVVATIVKLCMEAGAKKVKVFDNTLDDKRRAYSETGIGKAAQDAGADTPFIDDSRFAELEIPDGKILKKWLTYRDALECDVLINVPVAKVHGSSGLTLAMKNLMGIIGGKRGVWHQDLHTHIADFSTAVKCDLTVIDGYRVMLRNGPRGGRPDDVELKKTIAVCKDVVAADAFAAKELFGRDPQSIGYIKQAHERGLGNIEYDDRLLRL